MKEELVSFHQLVPPPSQYWTLSNYTIEPSELNTYLVELSDLFRAEQHDCFIILSLRTQSWHGNHVSIAHIWLFAITRAVVVYITSLRNERLVQNH